MIRVYISSQSPILSFGRRRHDGVVPIRDRGRTRLGSASAQRRGRLDVLDHARRAQGPRGEPGHDPAQGRRARCPQGASDLEGAAGRRGRRFGPGQRPRRPGDRRWPGRHRPRRAAAPARREPCRRGPARPPRRPVAQPVQVVVPARPRVVRPPALPAVPAQLAGSGRARTTWWRTDRPPARRRGRRAPLRSRPARSRRAGGPRTPPRSWWARGSASCGGSSARGPRTAAL